MIVRYTDPANSRTMLVEVVGFGAGKRRAYVYRLLDNRPGRLWSEDYRFYLDAVKAGLEAARLALAEPPH